jgi:hypothetical protein
VGATGASPGFARRRAARVAPWAAAAVLAAGCGPIYPHTNAQPLHTAAVVPVTDRIRHPYIPPPPPPVDPGTLPQTSALPRSDDPVFQAGVQALWQGIVTGNASAALPFFFPSAAYVQVKAIWDPEADYQGRLIALYRLDIQAAHEHLGADAASAQLLGVQVPTEQAEWIEPGVEYNKGSYYRVYGTRLAYQVDGQTHSIGIFSLISWRGEWYVVHLGPSTRSGYEGIVYAPSW